MKRIKKLVPGDLLHTDKTFQFIEDCSGEIMSINVLNLGVIIEVKFIENVKLFGRVPGGERGISIKCLTTLGRIVRVSFAFNSCIAQNLHCTKFVCT